MSVNWEKWPQNAGKVHEICHLPNTQRWIGPHGRANWLKPAWTTDDQGVGLQHNWPRQRLARRALVIRTMSAPLGPVSSRQVPALGGFMSACVESMTAARGSVGAGREEWRVWADRVRKSDVFLYNQDNDGSGLSCCNGSLCRFFGLFNYRGWEPK